MSLLLIDPVSLFLWVEVVLLLRGGATVPVVASAVEIVAACIYLSIYIYINK